jgi:plastocyanin
MIVRPGTTVTWTNRDDIPHIVAGTDRSFTSPVLDTEAAYSRSFSTPGQYGYFCTLHPHMTGRIVVRA